MTLIDRIAPTVVAKVESDKEAIIAASGSMVARVMVRAAWPQAMAMLPAILEKCYEALLEEVGRRSIADVTGELLADYRAMMKARDGETR